MTKIVLDRLSYNIKISIICETLLLIDGKEIVMKKLGIIMVGFMFVMCLMGCKREKKKEILIKEDYLAYAISLGEKNLTIENIEIIDNYGEYNGAYVVKMNRGAYQVQTMIEVGGLTFQFPDSNTPLVWKNRTFYEMEDAYQKNILNLDDLTILQDKINKDS